MKFVAAASTSDVSPASKRARMTLTRNEGLQAPTPTAMIASKEVVRSASALESHVIVPDDAIRHIFSFLDVITLEAKINRVCQYWKCLGDQVAMAKAPNPAPFQHKDDLKKAVDTYQRKLPYECEHIAQTYGWPIGRWNVSAVTDMNNLFRDAEDFNENLSTWDVSAVTDMSNLFQDAKDFDQDISGWDTSQVTDMSMMFCGAFSFNQNISGWDTSSVVNMTYMFSGASSFNQDLSSWNTSAVRDMDYMFSKATSFDQDLSSWDINCAVYLPHMFSGADSFSQDVSSWKWPSR